MKKTIVMLVIGLALAVVYFWLKRGVDYYPSRRFPW